MKILAFDTETGDLDPQKGSLLTAYFEVLDENLNTVDKLSLKVMPDDGVIKANPQALAINKIDPEKHKLEAITYTEAKKQLSAFLGKHSSKYDKLIPLAHNIDFDLGFVHEHLLNKQTWESYASYRKLDTANLANFFKLVGWFPKDQKMSLGDIAKNLEIEFNGDAHTADADVGVMVQILKTFVMSLRE